MVSVFEKYVSVWMSVLSEMLAHRRVRRNDMRFWRNPEIKRQMFGYLAVAVAFTAAAWFCMSAILTEVPWDVRRGGCLAAAGLVLAAVCLGAVIHFVSTARRYDALSRLTEQLDQFLHGEWTMDFGVHQEGELSILQDEIRKMTGTLRQQADALQGEKQYLCDAITDLSHQLRTPLTSLNLIQTMLAEPDLDPERRAELLRQLKVLLRRIDDLLVVLLKMARIDAGAVTFGKEKISVAQLVEVAAEPLQIPMDVKGQTLILQETEPLMGRETESFSGEDLAQKESASFEGDLAQKESVSFEGDLAQKESASFHGDLAWTAEALGNILKNCMEHTPEGGHIWVRWQENGVYTEVCVEDDGPGIDPEDLPHILERFYKGKHQGSAGFGVGLAFARMVTAAQNGVLTAENRREGGARFVMRFYKGVI